MYKPTEMRKLSIETDKKVKELCDSYKVATPVIMYLLWACGTDREANDVLDGIAKAKPTSLGLLNAYLDTFEMDAGRLKQCILEGRLPNVLLQRRE